MKEIKKKNKNLFDTKETQHTHIYRINQKQYQRENYVEIHILPMSRSRKFSNK